MSWHTLGSFHGRLEVTLAASSMITRDSILIGSGLVASLVFVLTVYVVTIRQTARVWTALVRRFPETEWPAGCKWHGAGAAFRLTRERRIVKLWLQDVESGPGSLHLGVSGNRIYVTPAWWRRIVLRSPPLASIPFEYCRRVSDTRHCGCYTIEIPIGSRNVFGIRVSGRILEQLQGVGD